MANRISWDDIKAERPISNNGSGAYEDEARISAFRTLVYRLRIEASMTQAELAHRMGTTQSAIARMEGGGTRPTLETLEKLAVAVGGELVVGVGENLSENRSIAKLVCGGEAMFRHASRPVRAVSVDSRHLNCRGVVHVVETGWTGRHFPGLEEA